MAHDDIELLRVWCSCDPLGMASAPDPERAARVASKMNEVIYPWVKTHTPKGARSTIARTIRIGMLQRITGMEVESTKDLPRVWVDTLDDWLGGRKGVCGERAAEILKQEFGLEVTDEEA